MGPIGLETVDPDYWKARLERADARGERRRAIYECSQGRWEEIEARERKILARAIGPSTSIIDAGCSYGRLIELLPKGWYGTYLGLDISPDFIREARETHKGYEFLHLDLREPLPNLLKGRRFDLAVVDSVRGLVARTLGAANWVKIEDNLLRLTDTVLFLEYGDA